MMNLESIKSILLAGLIILSLVLTFGIWNQKPNSGDVMDDNRFIETDTGGIEETKKSLLEPSDIIMEVNNDHYGLKNKEDEDKFYEYMHDWSLFEFESLTDSDIPEQENQVEVIFPVLIPFQVIKDLFVVDEGENIEAFNGEFNRIYILPNNNQGNVVVQFLNTKTGIKVKANVQNVPGVRNRLEEFREEKDLIEYVAYQDNEGFPPIYLPMKSVEMTRSTYTVSKINPDPYLINATFSDPSVVHDSNPSGLPSEQVYTDYYGMLRRFEYYMRFTDAKKSERIKMDSIELINQSVQYINKHKGWTTTKQDEYIMDTLETYPNRVVYRLFYREYPVFDRSKNLATIELIMRGSGEGPGVYQYNRPLIELKDSLGGPSSIWLKSGEQVIHYINNNRDQFGSNIQNISIGYQIEQTGDQDVFKLTPGWFIRDNLGWREITFKDTKEGGKGNAMGPN
ncbi:YycH family regulatory protein [Radiobacillus deserti]|uniref:Regulatory protein YycH domain-containing protein n=1 Tax=Radiobacillus deserti TaxID=2594883 RepID=A0A516KKT4_9BACI|nr:two-component system activity regulator YycH [Radiobacillus deserti]QDP42002.1 hypothetical protein FN924_18600 [Radiobacillus deserti]